MDSHVSGTGTGQVSFWFGEFAFDGAENIVATFSANANDSVAHLIAVDNIYSTTPTDTAKDTTDPGNLNLDVQKSGAVIGAAFCNTSTYSASWSGLTERDDRRAGNCSASLAFDAFSDAATNVPITADFNGGTSYCFLAISIR